MRNTIQFKKPIAEINDSEITFIILGATAGKNIKYPRSNISFCDGETLLKKQVDSIRQVFSLAQIYVVCGEGASDIYKNNRIKGVRYLENQNYLESGQCKSLGLGLLATIESHVIVIAGDVLINKTDLKNSICRESTLVIDTSNQQGDSKVGAIVDDEKISSLTFGLPQKWGQVTLFTGKELELLSTICLDKNKSNWFVHEAISYILSKNGTFKAKFGEMIEVNTNKDIERINKCLASK